MGRKKGGTRERAARSSSRSGGDHSSGRGDLRRGRSSSQNQERPSSQRKALSKSGSDRRSSGEPKKRPPPLKGVYEVLQNAKEPVWGQERAGWIVPRVHFDEVFAETTGIEWNKHMEPQMRLVPKTRRFGRFYEKTFVCNIVRLHLRS